MYINTLNTCVYIYIYMYLTQIYRYVKIHTKLNDLAHDEKFTIDSEIQTDHEAMLI